MSETTHFYCQSDCAEALAERRWFYPGHRRLNTWIWFLIIDKQKHLPLKERRG